MFLRLFAIAILLFVSTSVKAQSTSINLGTGIYAANGPGTLVGQASVFNDVEVRIVVLTSVTQQTRNTYGNSAWPVGTVVTVTYRDGTKEKFVVVAGTAQPVQAAPIANTQKDKDGKAVNQCDATCSPEAPPGASGGNEGGNSPGFWGSIWQWLISFLNQPEPTGTVTVGPIKNV